MWLVVFHNFENSSVKRRGRGYEPKIQVMPILLRKFHWFIWCYKNSKISMIFIGEGNSPPRYAPPPMVCGRPSNPHGSDQVKKKCPLK